MMVLGIRQAKAHLSELVRNAAKGECSLITDYRKPVAMIGPPPGEAHKMNTSPPSEDDYVADDPSPLVAKESPPSDAAAFRKALFAAPYPLELDF
jgi:antitoxin (DNA-binding transcriptional repressor) of toxin-antitoxin stability system